MKTIKFKVCVKERLGVALREYDGIDIKISDYKFFTYKNENKNNYVVDKNTGASLSFGKTRKEAVEKAKQNIEKYEKTITTKAYDDLKIYYFQLLLEEKQC